MFEKLKHSIGDKIISGIKDGVGAKGDDITSAVVTIAVLVVGAGVLFGAGMRLVPTRHNLHVYVHMH